MSIDRNSVYETDYLTNLPSYHKSAECINSHACIASSFRYNTLLDI